MKVLSILQPWASLVVTGHKTIETRSWATKYRGELLIHASKKIPTDPQLYINIHDLCTKSGFESNWHKLPFGAIIGKVNLVDVQRMESGIEHFMQHSNSDNEKEYAFGDWREGRYAWHLENPILFNTPIPAKGQLNLWNFDIEKYLEHLKNNK